MQIPVDELAQAIDALTFLDTIQLSLLPEKQELVGLPMLTADEIRSFKAKPFPHQVDAVNYGLTSSGKWLLLDSMGLGKSAELIWYAETLKNRGLIDHCLIICGVDSLRQNWKNEIKKEMVTHSSILTWKIPWMEEPGRLSPWGR